MHDLEFFHSYLQLFDSLSVSNEVCYLLITFANNMDLDQAPRL